MGNVFCCEATKNLDLFHTVFLEKSKMLEATCFESHVISLGTLHTHLKKKYCQACDTIRTNMTT